MRDGILIKYRYGTAAHHTEGHSESVIGIPNRRWTGGRKIFQQENLRGAIYYAETKTLHSAFEATGPVFTSDKATFSADPRRPGETWSMRRPAMMLHSSVGIPIAEFLTEFPDFNITRGSGQGLDNVHIDWIINRINATKN